MNIIGKGTDIMKGIRFGVGIFPMYHAEQTIGLAKLGEDLGYDSLWVGDSHLIWREVGILLGAIAKQTARVRIGTGVTHIGVRHVTVTASSIATLAEL